MTLKFVKLGLAISFVLIVMGLATTASAQQRMVNPVGRVKIDSGMAETPEFNVLNIRTVRGSKNWLEINVDYETVTDWVDELEFIFYVFIDTNFRDTPQMLLSYTVSYADIKQGNHKCSVYMHPNTYERYVDRVQFVGVEIRYKERPVRWTSDKSNMRDSQWWEQARQKYPPVSGKLMAREDSPFALVSPNQYELRKRAEK